MAALRSIENEIGAAPTGSPTRIIRVLDETGAAVCPHCTVAGTAWTRMRGLLGRAGLAGDEGLLIEPAPSVHMFFMRFAIDVVFLDKNRRIVGLAHTLRPWRVAGARKAVAALELPAGTALKHGLELGDVLTFEPA
jgi:uncharacterized protein